MTKAGHSESEYKDLLAEHQAVRRKLESKVEALVVVSQRLEGLQKQHDQDVKLIASLKRQYSNVKQALEAQRQERSRNDSLNEEQQQNFLQLLRSLKTENGSLEKELTELKQKLYEATGDVKVLRQQLARERLKSNDCESPVCSGSFNEHIPPNGESESNVCDSNDSLLGQLEKVKGQHSQLERDLKSVLCEKEELIIERDAYKNKTDRLNQELNYILNGDERRVMDIDELIMENKFLEERLQNAHEENGRAKMAISKYKNLLDSRRRNKSSATVAKPERDLGTLVTPRQVQEILQNASASGDDKVDYKALAGALLDAVNDKSLALSHQRKANKILGTRVTELESKLKSVELQLARSSGHHTPTRTSATDLEASVHSACSHLHVEDAGEQVDSGTLANSDTISDPALGIPITREKGPDVHQSEERSDPSSTMTNPDDAQYSDCIEAPELELSGEMDYGKNGWEPVEDLPAVVDISNVDLHPVDLKIDGDVSGHMGDQIATLGEQTESGRLDPVGHSGQEKIDDIPLTDQSEYIANNSVQRNSDSGSPGESGGADLETRNDSGSYDFHNIADDGHSEGDQTGMSEDS